jgi:glucosamine--fructose-6-phosphate aminotransferase (isomerizing)
MTTLMRAEALEAPLIAERQFSENQQLLDELAQYLNQKNPYSLVSIARGSSDHAAQYLNFLATIKLGKLSTSLSMSALTLYQAQLDVSKSLGIAISQSGQSPDIIMPIEYMHTHNAPTLAMVNVADSPLAKAAEWTIPLHAGPERSVAATKSFIASLTASASLIATWKNDLELTRGLHHLPDDLLKAQQQDWTAPIDALKASKRIMIVGRGYGLSLALEAALKLKETCSIQAEAFSAAEIKHGPQALIEEGYPLLIFANRGPALLSMLDLAEDMKSRGANVILAAPPFVKNKQLEIQSTHAEELDVISAIQSFYLMAEELSRSLGLNPDKPKHLAKVTKTK